MDDTTATFEQVKEQLAEFNRSRNWDEYHNPKDLAVSISIEAAELLENFQWKQTRQPEEIKQDEELTGNIKDEMADILIYLFIMANRLDIDLSSTMLEKVKKNEGRFPSDTRF
jgi:NTP pyrophosphatase (non-canonical NTP hydrolase)